MTENSSKFLWRSFQRHRTYLILTCLIVITVYNLSSFYFTIPSEPLTAYEFHETNPPPIDLYLPLNGTFSDSVAEKELRKVLDERTYDVPLHTSLLDWDRRIELYPKALMKTNWTNELPFGESLYFAKLQQICMTKKDAIIRSITPIQMQMESSFTDALVFKNDSALLSVLRDCSAIDVYFPEGLRGHGYCEDALAYLRGLKTRLLPRWVFTETFYDAADDRNLTYFEICPSTAVLFFNHYWDRLNEMEKWQERPIYLMPNIEMYELNAEHLWRSNVVLAKTVDAYQRITKWYQQNGNPRSTVVFYTRHTTSNIATISRSLVNSIEKDFDNVQITHTPGGSCQKNTHRICSCWERDSSMPSLDIFLDPELLRWEALSRYPWRRTNHSNYKLYTKDLSSRDYSDLLAHSAFFLCPSKMEGYGHYINQARAAGGVIITSNAPPMNELVTSTSGILIPVLNESSEKQLLGGKYGVLFGLKNAPGIAANVHSSEICEAVTRLVSKTSAKEREMMSQEAKKQYAFDTNFFLHKMKIIQTFAMENIAKKSELLTEN